MAATGGAFFGTWVSLGACGGSSGAPEDAGADASDAVDDDTNIEVTDDANETPDGGDATFVDDTGPDDAETFDGNSCQILSCPGKCVAGHCLLVLAQGGAYDLVVRSSVVYWTSAGSAPSTGAVLGAPTSPTASMGGAHVYSATQNNPHGLAVSGTNLYWANDSATAGAVLTIPLEVASDAGSFDASVGDAAVSDGGDGGAAHGVKALATGQASPIGVAIDATNLYWTTTGTSTTVNGTVVKMPLAGGTSITLASGRSAPSAIAVDATSVYWVDAGLGAFGGAVLKVAIAGGSVTTLASGQNSPGAIAVDSNDVYWTQQGTGATNSAVVKVPIGGGTVATIASEQGPVGGLTIDSTSIYWAVGGGSGMGAVLSAPLGGNVVTTLASGLDTPFDLATDATSLYWTDNIDGTITKLTPK
jgi:hypothetical protein